MKTSVLNCYRRELRWVKVKRFMHEFTVAAGISTLFFIVITALTSVIDLFF